MLVATPDVASDVAHETSTSLVYQPLVPCVPLTVAATDGADASRFTVTDALALPPADVADECGRRRGAVDPGTVASLCCDLAAQDEEAVLRLDGVADVGAHPHRVDQADAGQDRCSAAEQVGIGPGAQVDRVGGDVAQLAILCEKGIVAQRLE